jgi:outer membrane receptor for ferrienterochelin and colicins
VPALLRNLATGGVVPFSSVEDFGPLGADFSNTWELGYKGLFGNKLRIAVDYWYQIRPAEPTTQVINLDDAVFMDPGSATSPTGIAGYLAANMGGVLAANGVPPGAIPALIGQWANAMGPTPGGLLNFDNPLYDRNYLVFTYQSATGNVDVHGLDFATDYLFDEVYSLEMTYSTLSKNVFTKAPGASEAMPLTANAPKHRASVTMRYNNELQGLSGEVRGRYMDAFDVNSGIYNNYATVGVIPYERVPVNAFLDAGVSYRLPLAQDMRIGLNIQNILDNRVPSFIGVPEVGRFITTRIQYNF